MQEDIKATLEAWSVYGGFSEEMSELMTLPWLEARRHVHRVEDFVFKWSKQIESMGKSAMKLAILRDVDGIRKCVANLLLTSSHIELCLLMRSHHAVMHICHACTNSPQLKHAHVRNTTFCNRSAS